MATEENTTESQNSEATDQSTEEVKGDASTTETESTTETNEGDTILGVKVEDKPDDKAKKAEDDKPNALLGVPEGDYEIDVAQLPEGTKIDADALAVLTPIAKEIGLSNEGVTKLAGAYATILPNVVKQISDGIEADAAAQTKAWSDETRLAVEGGKDAKGAVIAPLADAKGEPVYAGKTMKEVRAIAAKALDNLGGPGLRQYLETTGLGNHEPLVRFAFKAGMAIKEDDFGRGDGPGGKPATLQSVLYGSKE